ncbi:MAG: glycoside hydrolase family 4 [Kiritimatiellaeota bacterium]|nr:glycoside hydrolase family 4 [Kiritimatiellota bacterium]
MRGPKITVIGAGSYFFGKPIIHKMATSEFMREGELALVDTDPKVLATMKSLAERVFAETGCDVKVSASTERREVLADSDFVVLSFSRENVKYRRVDTEIAFKHGIRMCSSDTIGPGGIFRSLRELPLVIDMAKDVAELAPNAWLINFVNPTSVLGMGLRRYAPEVRSFALCDGHHEPHNTLFWCKNVGILSEDAGRVPPDVMNKLVLKIGGVNHCTWLVKFEYDGKDMMPAIMEYVIREKEKELGNLSEKAKPRYNFHYAFELFDLYGVYPTAVSHTKEYVPFFQESGKSPVRPEPLRCFDADIRAREMVDAWNETTKYASGNLPIADFMGKTHDDHATDIIESMWGGLGKSFYINSPNRGAVGNLPYDAFIELRSDIDMRGPRPQPFGEFPRGVLALQHQILDTHELTAEAAMTGDRAVLKRAMLTDPLCNNILDAELCIEDLLAAERDVLPEYWFK